MISNLIKLMGKFIAAKSHFQYDGIALKMPSISLWSCEHLRFAHLIFKGACFQHVAQAPGSLIFDPIWKCPVNWVYLFNMLPKFVLLRCQ